MRKILSTFIILCCVHTLYGVEKKSVPDVLMPWIDWVKLKHADLECPAYYDNYQEKKCRWNAELSLDIAKNEGTFIQKWQLFSDAWVVLPGDLDHWPYAVRSQNRETPVVEKEQRPAIFLKKGTHTITGRFNWEQMPKSLKIPSETAVISLAVNNKKIPHVTIDKDGFVWFGRTVVKQEKKKSDETLVRVSRKISDGIPIVITSVLTLVISGRDRELLLGRFLPEDSVPMSLESSLPARIENNGNLRIQARAGKWQVTLRSRMTAMKKTFSMQAQSPLWPSQEIWIFEAAPSLRNITVNGVDAIDTSQLDITEAWKSLPAFLMTEKTKMIWTVEPGHKKNYISEPSKISRELWLDFDGRGYTVKDKIEGNLPEGMRLNVNPGYALGRVENNGTPVLITKMENSEPGVELRKGDIRLTAGGRYEDEKMIVPASGWNHDFDTARMKINLPPGWRIFHIIGGNTNHDTWISKWNVWDLFILFLIVFICVKTLSLPWAVFSAIMLLIVWHEPNTLTFSWLNMLIVMILKNVLPKDRMPKLNSFLSKYLFVSFAITAIFLIDFSIAQIRTGIYPQLERYTHINRDYSEDSSVRLEKSLSLRYTKKAGSASKTYKKEYQQYDAQEKVQTGPGEPTWNWNTAHISFSGPVERNQKLKILYIPPLLTRFLRFISVLFMVIFYVKLLLVTVGKRFSMSELSAMIKKVSISIIVVSIFCVSLKNNELHADIPPKELLTELESLILKEPSCYPKCMSMTQGTAVIAGNNLQFQLTIDAQHRTVIPLPVGSGAWHLKKVLINGTPASALAKSEKGHLLLVVNKGRNRVHMHGVVTNASLQVSVPFTVHNLLVDAPQWRVSGLIDGSLPGGTLQFDRISRQHHNSSETQQLLPDPIAPFVKVTRTLLLNNEWEVKTTVSRIAPQEGAINIEIPLIPGESPTDAVQVKKNKVTVSFAHNQKKVAWTSRLKMSDRIALQAPDHLSWVEVWQMSALPKWHIETEGLQSSKNVDTKETQTQSQQRNSSYTHWKPLPGGKLLLNVTRPKPVKGATMTVQRASLTYSPGNSISKTHLKLSVRASIGEKAHFNLPENIMLESVSVDGVDKHLSMQHNKLSVPLHPGMQEISVLWKDREPVSVVSKTPAIDLGSRGTNIEISYSVPNRRWVLFLFGPDIGPAILIWGILIVLLLVAFILGRIEAIPLKSWHWFLLFVGMSTIENMGGIFVVIWFVALMLRKKYIEQITKGWHNLIQVSLIILTFFAAASLFGTIPIGLLSSPDMQITGNGSTSYLLNWYQDFVTKQLPQATVVSFPLWVYRIVMLLWSFWMASQIPKWTKWGWEAMNFGSFWRDSKTKMETDDKEVTTEDKQ